MSNFFNFLLKIQMRTNNRSFGFISLKVKERNPKLRLLGKFVENGFVHFASVEDVPND